MVLLILFWLLWFLWFAGLFFPLPQGLNRAHGIIPAVLIGILGLKVFGSPLDK